MRFRPISFAFTQLFTLYYVYGLLFFFFFLGMTKGWSLTHSIPENIYTSHLRNYMSIYHVIKEYLDTQNVRLLSFNLVPHQTTTVVSLNVFWYKPQYRHFQSNKSKVFQPWTGWQSRWSRPPLTLWRPRLVQNLTHERVILADETNAEIEEFHLLQRQEKQQEREQLMNLLKDKKEEEATELKMIEKTRQKRAGR